MKRMWDKIEGLVRCHRAGIREEELGEQKVIASDTILSTTDDIKWSRTTGPSKATRARHTRQTGPQVILQTERGKEKKNLVTGWESEAFVAASLRREAYRHLAKSLRVDSDSALNFNRFFR